MSGAKLHCTRCGEIIQNADFRREICDNPVCKKIRRRSWRGCKPKDGYCRICGTLIPAEIWKNTLYCSRECKKAFNRYAIEARQVNHYCGNNSLRHSYPSDWESLKDEIHKMLIIVNPNYKTQRFITLTFVMNPIIESPSDFPTLSKYKAATQKKFIAHFLRDEGRYRFGGHSSASVWANPETVECDKCGVVYG